MYQVINISLSFHMTSQNCFCNRYYVKVTLACTVSGHTFQGAITFQQVTTHWNKGWNTSAKATACILTVRDQFRQGIYELDSAAHFNRGKPEGQCCAAPTTGKAATGSPATASWEQSSRCYDKDEHKPLLHVKTPLHGFHGYQNNYIQHGRADAEMGWR